MSDAEGEPPVPLLLSNWLHLSTTNATERHLGRKLRAMYDALPTQPPPEELGDLLRRLDESLGNQAE